MGTCPLGGALFRNGWAELTCHTSCTAANRTLIKPVADPREAAGQLRCKTRYELLRELSVTLRNPYHSPRHRPAVHTQTNMADADSGYSTSSSSNWDAPPAAEAEGGGMDMSAVGAAGGYQEMEAAEAFLAGESVKIRFRLPNGEEAAHPFPHGQTVQFLKVWLEDNHGLDYNQQNLLIGGKVLIDPLSLNDIKEIQTGDVENIVDVKLE